MKVSVNYTNAVGKIKPMNAVNNGPVYTKNADQNMGNMQDYKAANIPYARTHDASFFSRYGGDHSVDVHLIFRNFDADPTDPANYDFRLTDEYMETIMAAGTEVYYRLGSKIEHESVKYGTLPPKDFKKWAVICEHIIAHMNEGWADGHHYGIKYWEIWNEPDGSADDAPYVQHKTWGGTREQFYDLYEITAKHLRECFGDTIKIGGPALCWVNEPWIRPFFERVRDRKIPLDFFSWHRYCPDMAGVLSNVRLANKLFREYGLDNVESHLNEWNYVRSFCGEDWRYSLKQEASIKGGAFVAAVMSVCQNEPVDMLMYYDARPCGMNGLFKSYTYEKLKGYYAIATWGELLAMGTQCEATTDIPDLYVTAAKGEDGKTMTVLTYYTDNDAALPKTFTLKIDGAGKEEFTLSLLDESNDLTPVALLCADEGRITVTMQANTLITIK